MGTALWKINCLQINVIAKLALGKIIVQSSMHGGKDGGGGAKNQTVLITTKNPDHQKNLTVVTHITAMEIIIHPERETKQEYENPDPKRINKSRRLKFSNGTHPTHGGPQKKFRENFFRFPEVPDPPNSPR